MAEEESAILPRRVTEEDKKAAAKDLVPHLKDLNKEHVARAKQVFAELRGLTLNQVEAIILEVKRKASRE